MPPHAQPRQGRFLNSALAALSKAKPARIQIDSDSSECWLKNKKEKIEIAHRRT